MRGRGTGKKALDSTRNFVYNDAHTGSGHPSVDFTQENSGNGDGNMKYLILAGLIYFVIYMLDFKGYRRDGKQWAHIIERERYCCEHGRQRTASQF